MGWPVLMSACIPVSARATAAWRLAAAACRSVATLSCSAGISVALRLLADCHGHRLAGPGGHPGAAHRAGTLPGFQGGGDRAQRRQFSGSLGEPDVSGSHLSPGALAVLGLAGLDEFLGAGELGAPLPGVGGVGGEMCPGRASLSSLTALICFVPFWTR